MKMTRLFGLLVLCIAVSLAVVTTRAWLNQEQVIVSSGEAKVGGPFELTGHTGDPVKSSDFTGKYMLMYFGYTFCPDICPAELQIMSAALDQLGEKGDVIQPIFVTVDPERDTVDIMRDYVGHFHPRMLGLTGTPEQIKRVADVYRVYFSRVKGENPKGDYLMDHSSIVYLMGPDGKFIKHFAYGTPPDKMAAGLIKILDKS